MKLKNLLYCSWPSERGYTAYILPGPWRADR